MDYEKLTNKSKQVIEDVIKLAVAKKHQHITPIHLLKILLDEKDGQAADLIAKSGGSLPVLQDKLNDEINRLPKVEGGNVQSVMSQEFTRVMMDAEMLAEKSGDQYVTVERILQALATSGGKAAELLKEAGVNPVKLNQNINDFRQGRIADSETAEDNFAALKKFTIDITEKAASGKLDPVIGREHEIRRTIQVLS